MAVKNILTIDVEDWFHICGVNDFLPRQTWPSLESRVKENTFRILDILDQARCRATFFVLGSVAESHPGIVQKIRSAGHEIASHGYNHKRVYTMDPDTFKKDLQRSVDILSGITGQRVLGFRAPEWSIREDSLWALDILAEAGFVYDSSMAPLHMIGNPAYPRTPWTHHLTQGILKEFPPLVGHLPFMNLPLGGGWGFRTFPYIYIASAIRRLNQSGMPAVIFLHPREFDPKCPRVELPFIKRLVLNAGLEDTAKRLHRLLKDFEFTSTAGFISGMYAS